MSTKEPVKPPVVRSPDEVTQFVTRDGTCFDNFQEAGRHQHLLDIEEWLSEELAACFHSSADLKLAAAAIAAHFDIKE